MKAPNPSNIKNKVFQYNDEPSLTCKLKYLDIEEDIPQYTNFIKKIY